MNVSLFPQELDVLLRRSGVSALNPELCQGLVQACQALPSEAGQQVAWPVLLDMLDALVVLSADETLLIAALLFDLPMLRPMLPVLPWRSSTHQQMVGSLLDGQDAAEQVWTLHPDVRLDVMVRGCVGCCWRLCMICVWCRFYLPDSWLRCVLQVCCLSRSDVRWRN